MESVSGVVPSPSRSSASASRHRNACFGPDAAGGFRTRDVTADDFVFAFKRIADFHMEPGWAYGYFEDGHIAGHALFEYEAGADGHLRWKRIAAKLE